MTIENGKTLFDDVLGNIPATGPRPISMLPGLKQKVFFNKTTLFPIFFFLAIISLFFVSILSDNNLRASFSDMKAVEAKVASIELKSGDECGSKSVNYSFITPDNKTFYGVETVKKGSAYYNLQQGNAVPVKYNPQDPMFNTISAKSGNNRGLIFIPLMMCLFMVAILVALMGPVIKPILEGRKIFSKGVITKAEVLFIRPSPINTMFANFQRQDYLVFYRFRNSSGNVIESSTATNNSWIFNRLNPGDTVRVAYLEDKPGKSIILECFVR